MLYTDLLSAGATICRHAGRMLAALRYYCVGGSSALQQMRDYALPNSSWNSDTLLLYDKYMKLTEGGAWKRMPSYNKTIQYIEGKPVPGRSRLFTRNLEEDGVGCEYCMFFNKAEKRMVCIFQPGPYLEGPPGYTHGGCIATMIDSTMWTAAIYSCGKLMTANLNINYRNPVPLGATVVVDSRVDKIEGRKVYASCQVRSHDEETLHTEAIALLIKANERFEATAD